jgi:hypothetical protein
MRLGQKSGAAALAAALAWSACVGAADAKAGAGVPAGACVIRQIDDPATGRHWLLERDPEHPGWPGRLVEAPGLVSAANNGSRSPAALPSPMRPMILAGDQLVVSDETDVIRVRLEAVALQPARVGRKLRVRLKFSGKVMDAVAIGSGRAKVAGEAGGWR